jgi:hypothetical protein
MKITPALLTTLLAATLVAQEPAPGPAKPQLRSTPPSPVAPPPGLTSEPLPLIPETPETTEKPHGSALVQTKRDKTSDAENELAARIRLREIRNQALKDPKIQAEWTRAHAVKTDAEKRAALTSYYTLLYTKMAKLDGSLQKRITVMQTAAVRRLTQRNIEPSEVIEDSGYDDRSGSYDERNR